MTLFIRRCILLFLLFESIVFLLLYCFGPKSLKTLYDISEQKQLVAAQIDQIVQENMALEKQIEFYSTPFAQEKIAREKLLMKREGETVYFIHPHQ